MPEPIRRQIPDNPQSRTHKFHLGGRVGYITVEHFEDGMPAQVYIVVDEGLVFNSLVTAFASVVSVGLERSISVQVLVGQCANLQFGPSGETSDPDIPSATSFLDYASRWLVRRYPADAPPCGTCGTIMFRSGEVWKCINCKRVTAVVPASVLA